MLLDCPSPHNFALPGAWDDPSNPLSPQAWPMTGGGGESGLGFSTQVSITGAGLRADRIHRWVEKRFTQLASGCQQDLHYNTQEQPSLRKEVMSTGFGVCWNPGFAISQKKDSGEGSTCCSSPLGSHIPQACTEQLAHTESRSRHWGYCRAQSPFLREQTL